MKECGVPVPAICRRHHSFRGFDCILEEKVPINYILNHLSYVLHLLGLLHVFIMVDISMNLQAEKSEPQPVQFVFIQLHGTAAYILK